MQQIRNMTQQERYEQAKAKLKTFEAKHGNKLMFPSNQREHRLAARRYDLQDAVADAYWTDEMEKAIRLARAKGQTGDCSNIVRARRAVTKDFCSKVVYR